MKAHNLKERGATTFDFIKFTVPVDF